MEQHVTCLGLSLGSGAACAIALADAGDSLCLVQRPGSTNLQTFNTITSLGNTVKIVECDIADHGAVRTLFERALDVMGGEIHVLVNCAGIQRRSPATEFSEKDWDDVRTPTSLFYYCPTLFRRSCGSVIVHVFFEFPSDVSDFLLTTISCHVLFHHIAPFPFWYNAHRC